MTGHPEPLSIQGQSALTRGLSILRCGNAAKCLRAVPNFVRNRLTEKGFSSLLHHLDPQLPAPPQQILEVLGQPALDGRVHHDPGIL